MKLRQFHGNQWRRGGSRVNYWSVVIFDTPQATNNGQHSIVLIIYNYMQYNVRRPQQ